MGAQAEIVAKTLKATSRTSEEIGQKQWVDVAKRSRTLKRDPISKLPSCSLPWKQCMIINHNGVSYSSYAHLMYAWCPKETLLYECGKLLIIK